MAIIGFMIKPTEHILLPLRTAQVEPGCLMWGHGMKFGVGAISFPPLLILLIIVSPLPTRGSLCDSHGQGRGRDSWKGQSQHIELGEAGRKGCTMGLCPLGENTVRKRGKDTQVPPTPQSHSRL